VTSEFLHLPKIELHLHLDCSLSFDVVRKIKPDTDWETYRRDYVAAIDEFRDLYQRECRKSRIDYVPLDTSMQFDRALTEYLASRRGR